MASKKTSKGQSKSDFIRSQPLTLSAIEVVAKAKAAGIKFSPQLVYNVRNGSKAKKGTAKKTSPAKPAVASKAPAKGSKADFVREHASLSPKDIVAKAKTEGLELDVTYVYNIRGYDKSKGKTTVTKQAARRATSPRRAPPVQRPITNKSSAEDLLRAVAAEIGLARAVEILTGERARVRAMIGG
jgi:hypothetical protein